MSAVAPVCEFCRDEPAAVNKSDPKRFRKYCGDLCMGLNTCLKPVLSDATDRAAIRLIAESVLSARRDITRLVEAAQPPDPRYSNGYPAYADTLVRQALTMVQGQADDG